MSAPAPTQWICRGCNNLTTATLDVNKTSAEDRVARIFRVCHACLSDIVRVLGR